MRIASLSGVLSLLAVASANAQPLMVVSNETGTTISTLNIVSGTIGTYHSGLANPDGIMFAPDGMLYATSFTGGTFNRITSSNSFTTIASGMNGSAGFARDAGGNFYVVNYGNPSGGGTTMSRITPAGTINVAFATGLSTPDDVKFDPTGTFLYVSEWGGNRIRRVNPTTGVVSPFIDGTAGLDRPSAMAIDTAGNIFVTNWGNGSISRITPGGVVTNNYATGVANSFGLLLDEPGGFFYATSWTAGTVNRFPYLGGAATVIASGFQGPTFMAFVPIPEPATLLGFVVGLFALSRFAKSRCRAR